MSRKRWRTKLLWLALAAIAFAALVWSSVQQMLGILAVRAATSPDVLFDWHEAKPPSPLVGRIRWRVSSSLLGAARYYRSRSETGREDLWRLDAQIRDPVNALFGGPIDSIVVCPGGILSGKRDLGGALLHFRSLRELHIRDYGDARMTKSDWIRICRRLHKLPRLEELHLHGSTINDLAIAQLHGNRQLRFITIRSNRLTSASALTFASMPNLETLELADYPTSEHPWGSFEEEEAMRSAIPGVTILIEEAL